MNIQELIKIYEDKIKNIRSSPHFKLCHFSESNPLRDMFYIRIRYYEEFIENLKKINEGN